MLWKRLLSSCWTTGTAAPDTPGPTATRLCGADGEGLECDADGLVLAGDDPVPVAGRVAPDVLLADVDAGDDGPALECLPRRVASAYAPPPAASTRTIASTISSPLLPRPPPRGGPAGGPGEYGAPYPAAG